MHWPGVLPCITLEGKVVGTSEASLVDGCGDAAAVQVEAKSSVTFDIGHAGHHQSAWFLRWRAIVEWACFVRAGGG